MDGCYLVPLSLENRTKAGVEAGMKISVTVENDTEPRTVAIPPDLVEALSQIENGLELFEKLSNSARKEHVRQVESAKTSETRQRRIKVIISKLFE